jgi:ATP-dependent RNA helicase DDX5/DBP2
MENLDKKERKQKLIAEAEKLGISYKELKAQKKEAKANKRSREADKLDSSEHKQDVKRMRAWSHDEKENGDDSKRRRTRSIDAQEEQEAKTSTNMTPEEWRKDAGITIRGHGKYAGLAANEFAKPFFKFSDAPFSQAVLRTFDSLGYKSPTAIQAQSWPIALKGDDMICIAKTGSGKTCGFLLPSLHQHMQSGRANRGFRKPVLLVLAPTRELAVQIMEETRKFGRPFGAISVCCYGGSSKYPQIAALERGVDCIIATPGRINDLLEMKKADLSSIKFLVLDEADRMLDMGFEPQIRSVIKHVPDARQTLLFSATWPKEIQRLAHDFLKDPIQVNVGEVGVLNANKDITQHIHMISENEKHAKLTSILKELVDEGRPKDEATGARSNTMGKQHAKVIVFTARKHSCNDLANQLWDEGFSVDCLHGDRQQWERTKVMNAFKDGTLRMLIATDVAARGLDVKDVGVVVNYDMPAGTSGVEDYVHRIGRTGRAGKKGVAHTFFTQADSKNARQLVEVLTKAEQVIPEELQALARPRFSIGRGGSGRGGRGYMGRGGRGGFGRGRGGRGRGFGRGRY